jgi:hypothetical protein
VDSIDAKIFGIIIGGTTLVVGILKKLFPKWVDGKEEVLAQVFPIIFTMIAKLAGGFKATGWDEALIFAIGAGLGAGVVHDKLINPFTKKDKAD